MHYSAPNLSSTLKPQSRDGVKILGIGTALPPLRVSQPEALKFLLERYPLHEKTQELYRKVFANDSISTRFFALENLEELLDADPDRTALRFEKWAVELSRSSLEKALRNAGIEARNVDFLAAATCTGSLCPGISAHLVEKNGLRQNVRLADMGGMGCGAALPALEQAHNFVRANPGTVAAVVCTEICSAAMYSDNAPDLVVSNALFSDGSAAVILGGEKTAARNDRPSTGPLPQIQEFASWTNPEWRDTLRFRTENGRLRNVLGRHVPEQAGTALCRVLNALLARQEMPREAVTRWILHAGGQKVLDALREKLAVEENSLQSARQVLRLYGNMSSPSVFFILQREQLYRPPRHGEWGVLASFGAGFSAHAALIKY